jgi:hypothetical protein
MHQNRSASPSMNVKVGRRFPLTLSTLHLAGLSGGAKP